MTERISRRQLLGMAGAAAAGVSAAGAAGLGGAAASAATVRAAARGAATPAAGAASELHHFFSRPDLKVPKVTVLQEGSFSPSRYIFLDVPSGAPGGGGAMIMDARGGLVWFGPDTSVSHKLDFNAQTLNGQPVLTWWQGQVVDGHGEGKGAVSDSSYQLKYLVNGHNGVAVDLHEFNITPQGTALITAYRTHSGVDLTGVGGPKSGYIYSGVFQEIDIVTGNLIFEWDSYNPAHPALSPVPVTETHLPFVAGRGTKTLPFDYFHINSVDLDADGNYVVSARHTWTIYNISKTGINWRLGGKRSHFTLGPGARFAWQHHVRVHGTDRLSIFDNGTCTPQFSGPETRSRGLILSFDTTTRKAALVKEYIHPGVNVLAHAEGSTQILPSGEVFMEWGTEHRFTQFTASGKVVLDGILVKGASSYRGFSNEWKGNPADVPAAAARSRSGGGATVYASWNGATEVASWVVFAGRTPTTLSRVGSAPRTGFETAIAVASSGPYFAVHALDAASTVLASSAPVKIA